MSALSAEHVGIDHVPAGQGRHSPVANPFRQPRAVWAVAFACVVSFMGIGLVDPILPSLTGKLHATPAQVELLFTSYLVVTAVAMLVTGWVSSRIGAKRTLVAGLALIVVFSLLAGASGSIGQIVGFRAGWGLGNALFIATSLAVIVGSASGGFAGAIVLYETALGIGIATGPLVGSLLGGISWRGPFFGVTTLMAIALVATIVLVKKALAPATRLSLTAPLRALRHRGLLTMGVTALLYNWGFFTVVGFAPFPMHLDTHQLGIAFTGWGWRPTSLAGWPSAGECTCPSTSARRASWSRSRSCRPGTACSAPLSRGRQRSSPGPAMSATPTRLRRWPRNSDRRPEDRPWLYRRPARSR
jgi:MFS transporter, ACDE family, multidrug resistance protein